MSLVMSGYLLPPFYLLKFFSLKKVQTFSKVRECNCVPNTSFNSYLARLVSSTTLSFFFVEWEGANILRQIPGP